jgi:hypothetical protein
MNDYFIFQKTIIDFQLWFFILFEKIQFSILGSYFLFFLLSSLVARIFALKVDIIFIFFNYRLTMLKYKREINFVF